MPKDPKEREIPDKIVRTRRQKIKEDKQAKDLTSKFINKQDEYEGNLSKLMEEQQ